MAAIAKVTKQSLKPVKEVISGDTYAIIKVVESACKKARDKLGKSLKTSMTVDKPLNSEKWSLSLTKSPTSGLNTEKIRAEMSAEWLKKYELPGVREEIKCTSLTGVDAQVKKVEFTDELCEDLLAVLLKHAKRQHNSAGKS